MPKRAPEPPPIEPKVFRSVDEINHGISKLKYRILDLEKLDVARAITTESGEDNVAISDVRESIRDVFGTNSPEFHEHQYLRLWAGPQYLDMDTSYIIAATELGRKQAIVILEGLIRRLGEKRESMQNEGKAAPSSYFMALNLHPRILGVSQDLFLDGHHWPAVFEASKALINFIKERSRKSDLDGAPLMRTVFSRNNPILAFNSLSDQTDHDEQEGMMHLFEGAMLAIRNRGSHAFPEGPEQRAFEYIMLLSLLAYRVEEAKFVKPL